MSSLAVVIGRFQIVHDQHVYLIREAMKVSEVTLVLVGSVNTPRTPKNPFTQEERHRMLSLVFEDEIASGKVHLSGIEDYVRDSRWEEEVVEIVQVYLQVLQLDKVTLVGHSKDESSYYLKSFPQFSYQEIPARSKTNATSIRSAFFEHRVLEEVPVIVSDYLNSVRMNSDWFQQIKEEYRYNKVEQCKLLDHYPYKSSLNVSTADTVVSCFGKHLLVKRKDSPYKGCWALAGGHKDSDETYLQAALRELVEETSLDLTGYEVNAEKMFDKVGRDPVCSKNSMCYFITFNQEKYKQTPPVVVALDDAVEVGWFTTDELINMKEVLAFDHYEMLDYFLNLED